MMTSDTIFNFLRVNDRICTSGMPTAGQIQALAAEGFQAVVNLAPPEPGHGLVNEAELVQALGMSYYPLPVLWNNPTAADFHAFEAVLRTLKGYKILIHCVANFRATAFYSLYALKNLGWSREQARAFREKIWQGSSFPIWEAFIQQMEDQIAQRSKGRGAQNAGDPGALRGSEPG